MLVSDIIRRVRQKIEDENSTAFPDDDVIVDTINEAKDEILLQLITSIRDMCQKSEVISFAEGITEVSLNANSLGIVKLEPYPFDSSDTKVYHIDDFGTKELWENDDKLWYRADELGNKYLGRKFTDSSLSLTVYYLTDVNDVLSSSSVVFIPRPALILLITKVSNLLLAMRNRTNPLYVQKESVQSELFEEMMHKKNTTRPRYVHYTPS